jgi:hypothetical protein
MNGDFARITFDPKQHFSRVLLQQGRMLLEADYNEQSAIHHYFLRTLITDLVGRCWRAGTGFALDTGEDDDFKITKGHFYVDGILCENDSDCTYTNQPYGPVPSTDAVLSPFMAYIECWERHVSAAQIADLREIALGGRDTATRAQIVWQVRIVSQNTAKEIGSDLQEALAKGVGNDDAKAALDAAVGSFNKDCEKAQTFLDLLDVATPQLRAMAKRSGVNLDPCAIAADSQYRGRENQLYRIEVHAPGAAGKATLKWSRENGSIAFRIAGEGVSTAGGGVLVVEIEAFGRDRRTGLCEGDWVEISSREFEFGAVAGSLGQVTKIDLARRIVTLKVDPASKIDFESCTLLRRWDQVAGVNPSGTINIVEGTGDNGWITLERGIQIQLVPGGFYRTGDYWLIPARVASGDIIWPQDAGGPAAIPPDGIKRHRAPIGSGKKGAGGAWNFPSCGCTQQPLCKK